MVTCWDPDGAGAARRWVMFMDPKTRRRRDGDPADRPTGVRLSWQTAQINRVRCKNGEFRGGRSVPAVGMVRCRRLIRNGGVREAP